MLLTILIIVCCYFVLALIGFLLILKRKDKGIILKDAKIIISKHEPFYNAIGFTFIIFILPISIPFSIKHLYNNK